MTALVMACDAGDSRAGEVSRSSVGALPCRLSARADPQTCEAEIVATGPGSTVLKVTFPNGAFRLLTFENGIFVRANPTMAGVGRDVSMRREGERLILAVDGQQYEVPKTLVEAD